MMGEGRKGGKGKSRSRRRRRGERREGRQESFALSREPVGRGMFVLVRGRHRTIQQGSRVANSKDAHTGHRLTHLCFVPVLR